VDIDQVTYTMDPNYLEAALARPPAGTPKAVIPVHLYGHPADMPSILELAKRHGLYVIEDCAQSHGATLDRRMTGAWGDIGAFSFYPTKNLGAIGDGGAIITNDISIAEKVKLLRQYGWGRRYVSEIPGLNSRLDEIQAAILQIKLNHLDVENSRRREIAKQYSSYFQGMPLTLPQETKLCNHVYHQYVIRSSDRDSLKAFLYQKGIGTLIHYPLPVHMQPAYKNRIFVGEGGLSNTEIVSQEVLSLPMYPQLSDAQIEQVCMAVKEWCKLK